MAKCCLFLLNCIQQLESTTVISSYIRKETRNNKCETYLITSQSVTGGKTTSDGSPLHSLLIQTRNYCQHIHSTNSINLTHMHFALATVVEAGTTV